MNVDTNKIGSILDGMVEDLGPIYSGALVVLGDRLGLFRAFGDVPRTAKQLADRHGGANGRRVGLQYGGGWLPRL